MVPGKNKPSIVCMGSVNIDFVMFVDQFPGVGETVIAEHFGSYPGGKGGNQAITAAQLGCEVTFLGKFGMDRYSEELLVSLRESGVNIDHVIKTDGSSGVAMISVDRLGRNSISYFPSSSGTLAISEVHANRDLFQPGRVLLATFEAGVDIVYEAAKLSKSRDMLVVVDPAPMSMEVPADLHLYVDVIKPNEIEASQMTGIPINDLSSARLALGKLITMGYRCPVITLGSQGVVYYADGAIHHQAAVTVHAIDSTAAGDVFAGALACCIAQGRDMHESIRFASAAAALCTTVKGARTSIPTLESVSGFLNSLV